MSSRRVFLLAAVLLVALSLAGPHPASAQSEITVVNPRVTHIFGQQIDFQAELTTSMNVAQVQLIFRPAGSNRSIVTPVQYRSDGLLTASYALRPQDRIPPFARINYWYIVTTDGGQQFQSEVFSHRYDDNRFSWQQLVEPGIVQVHWYQGDLAFGQAAVDTALNASDHLDQYIRLPAPTQLDIYIYPSQSELQAALSLSGQEWLAGHADPDLNVVIVWVTPDSFHLIEMERRIPHEIAHIRLYQEIGEAYQNLPAWFNEGIASLGELYTNPDHRLILQTAAQEGTLIPLTDLCANFPTGDPQLQLAYAQSESFLTYLVSAYGANSLQNLLDAYAQGGSCSQGLESVYDASLAEMEKDWLQSNFDSPPTPSPSSTGSSLFAWVILFLLIMVVPVGAILLSGESTKEEITDG